MPNPPVIDPNEIKIETGEAQWPDLRFDFTLPAKCVQKILDRLGQADQQIQGPQLYDLLAHICFEEAVSRFNLDPLWPPLVLPGEKPMDLKPGDDFLFSGVLDAPQEIDWPDFSQLNIERPSMEISESVVNAELEEQCLDAGKPVPSTEPLARGDEATGQVWLGSVETDEGIIDKDGVTIRIPVEGRPALVEGVPVPNLAEVLRGAGVGDHVESETEAAGLEDTPELAGSTLVCRFEIKETHHIQPATVEEVVAQYGSPSEAGLRQQIYHSLELRFQREQMVQVTDSVLGQIEKLVDVKVPSRVIETDIRRQQKVHAESLSESGLDKDEIKNKVESIISVYKNRAIQKWKRHALSILLQRHFEIRIGEKQINDYIQLLASIRGERLETVRKELVEGELIDHVAAKCVENEIANRILVVANVTDVDAGPETHSHDGHET